MESSTYVKFKVKFEVLIKEAAEHNLVRDLGGDIIRSYFTQIGTAFGEKTKAKFQHTQTFWIVDQKYQNFREFRTPFPLRYIQKKNSGSMYARVVHGMVQFV